jgi:hypothetical protein
MPVIDAISSAERACGALAAEGVRVAFASVVGPSHVKRGVGGDDAAAAGASGPIAVAVVCDGAGSSLHGGMGARTVAPAFVEHVLTHAAATADAEALTRVVEAAIDHGLGQIEPLAATLGVGLSAFAATLVACIATPMLTLYAQIGDGALIAYDAADQVLHAGTGGEQEYANETYFVTDRTWRDSLRTQEIPRPASLLLMTDGVVPFAFESRVPKDAFCVPILRFLRGAEAQAGADALGRLLTRPDVEDLVYDDKTLLWLALTPVAAAHHVDPDA